MSHPTPSNLDRLIPPEIKGDRFYQDILRIALDPAVKTVLEIGSSAGEGSTEAWVRGMREQPAARRLFCMEVSRGRFDALARRYAREPFVTCCNVSSVGIDHFPPRERVIEFYQRTPTCLNRHSLEEVLGWREADIDYLRSANVPQNGIAQIKQQHAIEHFDAVLIDGSEFTGEAELEQVYGAGMILLDDVQSFKNWRNFQRLADDPDYALVIHDPNLRSGYAIFRRRGFQVARYDTISAAADSAAPKGAPPVTAPLHAHEKFLFDKIAALSDGATVLEVGAGSGRFSVAMGHACVNGKGRILCADPAWSEQGGNAVLDDWRRAIGRCRLEKHVLGLDLQGKQLESDDNVDLLVVHAFGEPDSALNLLKQALPRLRPGAQIVLREPASLSHGPLALWPAIKHAVDQHEYCGALACGRIREDTQATLDRASAPSSSLKHNPPDLRGHGFHIVVWTDDAAAGGVAQFTHSIACGLADAGYRVTCVHSATDHPNVAERQRRGVRHVFLDYDTGSAGFRRTVEDTAGPFEILRADPPDVILFSDCCVHSNFGAKRAARALGISFIVVEQYVDARQHQAVDLRPELHEVFNTARQIVCVSHENLELVRRNFSLPRGKGIVIHYGRPDRFFEPRAESQRRRVRAELNIPEDAIVCFTAARLTAIKGFEIQLQAMQQLKSDPTWRALYFIWAGSGELRAQLETIARQIGVADRIRFVGAVDDVIPYLDASDIFGLPSRAEGMPLAVMEAMARGLAVVATAVSGIPEELGETGQLIPPPSATSAGDDSTARALAQTLSRWVEDRSALTAAGQACRERASLMFREQRMIEQYIPLIQRALLPARDYVAPALDVVAPDAAFPHMATADPATCPWPYFRRTVDHTWYVDSRHPIVGFANRDEASILYNLARQFAGKPALEIGAWVGWSTAHLALGGAELDVIDPLQQQQDFADTVNDSLGRAGVRDRVNIVPGSSPAAVRELAQRKQRRWSLMFIDGNHDRPGPLEDAKVCADSAADDAAILFHDLVSPEVTEGLDYLRDQGWNTIIFQTAQIMGMAWRGNVKPPPHTPDPQVHWTMPSHLAGYTVSGADPKVARAGAAGAGSAELPVHFFTIVLNGQPFIRHHIEQFKKLPFRWHWHIIEGVADLKNDTAWSVARGGRIPPEFHRNGLSIDGTTEYLDALKARHPDHISLYRKSALWNGKLEMVAAPLASIRQECLLFQIDADELWTAEQLQTVRQLFLDEPDKTAAFYWCRFFVGGERVVITRGGYANNPRLEWLRTWRYRPGMVWAAHEPPILAEPLPGAGTNQWRDVGRVNPFSHDETERAGLVFQHFAYATLDQVRFKQAYYGYANAVAGWVSLQFASNLPQRLGVFLPWVGDDTLVDRVDGNVTEPLLAQVSLNPPLPAAPSQHAPSIVVDGVFFQMLLTGIARVWWCILSEWVRSGFAKHVLLLDRAGTMPPLAGVRRMIIPQHDYANLDRDRALLQQICDEYRADAFISTYYSTPLTTPSALLVHDMIPEVLGLDLNEPMWAEKQTALAHASRLIAVSENTKRDLVRFHPHISPQSVAVAHPGVWPNFKPRNPAQVEEFRRRFGISKPYFFHVGLRSFYKNSDLLFHAITRMSNRGAFDIICAGQDSNVKPEYRPLVESGILRSIGRVDDETLACAYSGALALVYPSFYEGFGLPIVEAMACGCPVITAATSSIPEVAGDAVIYVDPHDPAACAAAMLEVTRPDVRQRLIAAGLERVKRYRWDLTAQIIRDVLVSMAPSTAEVS